MEPTFTRNDLLKKLYNETDPTEDAAMTEAMEQNYELKEEYEALKNMKRKLNHVRYRPSRTSVKIILEHSKKTAPLETSY